MPPASAHSAATGSSRGPTLTGGPAWQPRNLLGLLDVDMLAARCAAELSKSFAGDLVCVTTVSRSPQLLIRGAGGERGHGALHGLAVPTGSVGGLAFAEQHVIAVRDYATVAAAEDFLELVVGMEGVRGAVGVPLCVDEHSVGVLFVGRRSGGTFADREIDLLLNASEFIAPLVEASLQADRRVELAGAEERQRLATELHDNVLPLLFLIGATARRMRDSDKEDRAALSTELREVEALASSVGSVVRNAVRELAPMRPDHRLSLRLRTIIARFRAHHPLSVELVEIGEGAALAADITTVLAAVVNEGLTNLVKHAPGASALVSLSCDASTVTVTVQDDGPGLPEGFALRSVTEPDAGEHFGLSNLARRVADLSGELSVGTNEDDGVTLRVRMPRTLPS
jgi:signal transduction histidine kinase